MLKAERARILVFADVALCVAEFTSRTVNSATQRKTQADWNPEHQV
jgi:hypothetical protein